MYPKVVFHRNFRCITVIPLSANQSAPSSTDILGHLLQPSRRSSLVSRNVSINGHRTSIRLEPEMWQALRDIATRERCTIHAICTLVAMRKRATSSLTAAIRVFVMLYYRAASTEEGHRRAGHGSLTMMMARAGVEASALARRLVPAVSSLAPVAM